MKLAHACIRVMNLEKSLDFYKNAIGLQETRRFDYPEWKFTLVYLSDMERNFEIEITYNYDQETPYIIGDGFSHFAVHTPDLPATHQRHTEQGYTVSEIKGLGDGHAQYYFITDPDGYRTEVIQEHS